MVVGSLEIGVEDGKRLLCKLISEFADETLRQNKRIEMKSLRIHEDCTKMFFRHEVKIGKKFVIHKQVDFIISEEWNRCDVYFVLRDENKLSLPSMFRTKTTKVKWLDLSY